MSAGNVPSPQQTPQSQTSFDAATNKINPSVMTGFGYDAVGNLTSDPTTPANGIAYDAEDRQTVYTKSGVGATSYSYDGDGRRVKRVTGSPSVTTVYVYDVMGRLVAEYNDGQQQPAGGTKYLTADHLGSTRLVTGQNQAVAARYDYLPYGEEISAGVGSRTLQLGYGGADLTKQKFTQKERDSESGLDYFLARYYSSPQGRFTSSDPGDIGKRHFANPQKWNKYTYTLDNPLRFVDPNGEEEFEIMINTFIPQKQVEAPGRLLVTTRYFHGDDRDVGGDESKYRTQQVIRIETDPNKNGGNPEVSAQKRVGETIELDSDGNEIGKATANGDTIGYSIARDEDGTVKVHVYGNEGNPLVTGAPGITYNFDININSEGPKGNATVKVSGEHDGFPAYEIKISRPGVKDPNEQHLVIYGRDPRTAGNTAKSLMSMAPNVKVNLPPIILTP